MNTQFGILALPTILLFHNSKPVSKFNHTIFNLDNYAQFLSTLTGIEANGLLEVTETDQVMQLTKNGLMRLVTLQRITSKTALLQEVNPSK